MISDVLTSQKYSKYCRFHEISLFPGKGRGPGFSLSGPLGVWGPGVVKLGPADLIHRKNAYKLHGTLKYYSKNAALIALGVPKHRKNAYRMCQMHVNERLGL